MEKPSKYKNKKVLFHDHTFDSRKEFDRYLLLMDDQGKKKISQLKCQTPFDLMCNGIKVCQYISDFTYYDAKGEFVVEDVKSEFTKKNPVYRLKKKLAKAQTPPIIITEI